VLTTLLLLRAGYVYVPYASLERVIEENKDLYYKALRRTQGTLKSETPDWEPWVGFFLRSLKKQKDLLARRLNDEKAQQQGDDDLPALSVEIIALFKNHARLDAGRIEELTGANRSTLKVRLRELVIAGRLRKHGKARATWYSI
jgi:Fic family protein